MTNTLNKKPAFHITGETGWINDPNGLVFFKGKYHAFFQYYPYDVKWGPMHWGHVVSSDLTHWEYLPIALTPTFEDGCFSGTAIVDNDKLYLLYTGFNENGGGDNIRQVQCLAESEDGVNFKKHGVVIDSDKLPKGYSPCDFRDPKIWKEGKTFYCAVAVKRLGGKGRIIIFESNNLFDWQFKFDLFGKDGLGEMIECPDYNKELGLLFYSEQFQPAQDYMHLNVHTTRWCVGEMDLTNNKFLSKTEGIVDYGFDFYAPQTFSEKDIIIGWMNMWDRNIPSAKHGFAGMLTTPRKISVVNNQLYQEPILKTKKVLSQVVENALTDNIEVGVIKIKAVDLNKLSIKLRSNENAYTSLVLEGDKWVFDRSKSGEKIVGVEKDQDSLNGIRRMPFSGGKECELTLVMDKYSVEIFEGGKSLTATIYPPENAFELRLEVDAKSCEYIREEIV